MRLGDREPGIANELWSRSRRRRALRQDHPNGRHAAKRLLVFGVVSPQRHVGAA